MTGTSAKQGYHIAVQVVAIDRKDPATDFVKGRDLLARLLAQFGCTTRVPRLPDGAPDWPEGFTGSLSRGADWAIGIVTRKDGERRVGIDTEPVRPLAEIARYAGTFLSEKERAVCQASARVPENVGLSLGFSAKETAMKAFSSPQSPIVPFDAFTITGLRPSTAKVTIQSGRGASIEGTTVQVQWMLFRGHVLTYLLYPEPPPGFRILGELL